MDKDFWTKNFNTQLSDQELAAFQLWLQSASKQAGRDLAMDIENYDLQGFWKDKGQMANPSGHLPDKFKKPNHPTFSDESVYSGKEDLWGGKFQGGRWEGSESGGWTFQPSARMLKTTHDMNMLRQYFGEFEPGSLLVSPFKNK